MSLFDTIDGCFMNFAYDWAFAKPIRKVYYNLTITGLSVFVAFFIGTIEILGLIGQEENLGGPFWTFFQTFNINTAGFFIVGVFVVTWAVALLIWRFGRIEAKWDAAAQAGPRGAHGVGLTTARVEGRPPQVCGRRERLEARTDMAYRVVQWSVGVSAGSRCEPS